MMGFELRVVRNHPLTGENDLDQALLVFLKNIGYLPENSEEDTGFKLVRDCLLLNPERAWTIDDILTVLGTNRSTLYRYLNKLKGLDILDEIEIPAESPSDDVKYRKVKKGYRFRFQSFSTAWGFVESHASVALENYRRSVEHIDSLSQRRVKGSEVSQAQNGPRLTVDGLILKRTDEGEEMVLVKRGTEPYKGMWALPGGFLESGETAEDAVLREISEETGLKCNILQLGVVASRPDRDPRGHTVSIVYILEVPSKSDPIPGDDADEAAWFPVDDLPDLAFDHGRIIADLKERSII